MDAALDKEKNAIGKVVHISTDKQSINIELFDKIKIGDTILIGDDDTYVEHKVEGMKIEGIHVNKGFNGDIVEIDIAKPIREGSIVYKASQ
ncbi:MAG: hypothetical protein QW194_02720 [Candidatus Micrarchaeaceae archaeon]|nr:hypothetical protein [Candidatus Marsarchaeota archaeon]